MLDRIQEKSSAITGHLFGVVTAAHTDHGGREGRKFSGYQDMVGEFGNGWCGV